MRVNVGAESERIWQSSGCYVDAASTYRVDLTLACRIVDRATPLLLSMVQRELDDVGYADIVVHDSHVFASAARHNTVWTVKPGPRGATWHAMVERMGVAIGYNGTDFAELRRLMRRIQGGE